MGFRQASSIEHPTVTTSPSSRIISSVGVLGWLEETSFQRSSIPWTTIGLILAEGIVPALSALSQYFLAKASAIWLRPAFSIQTNSTGPLANPGPLEESEDESGN